MDFLCKMSVSNIYFKLSFLVTKNKFSTTSSASLPLPKICRWRWHPKCPQIWVTASQPLFSPYIHTECPPPPPHFTAPIGWGQQDDGSGRKSGCSKRLHHAALRVSLLLHREEGRQRFAAWPLSVPGITGDGGRTRRGGHRGRGRSSISQFTNGTELMVISWGEKLSPQKNVWERKIQVGGGGGMKGEGVEVGGWGVFTYYMCDITRSLPFSTKIQRTSAGQSPSPQNQEKKNSQMYFLLTQRL